MNADLANGAITNVEYASHQTSLAKLLHPNERNDSSALRKFFESSIGRTMLAECRQPSASAMQDTYAKRGSADPMSSDMGDSGDNAPTGEDYAKMIKILVDKGMPYLELDCPA